jgi:hypothetical protein
LHRFTDNASYLTSRTIEIIVEAETKSSSRSFFVHADLLTSRSRFFAKALKNYVESKEQTGAEDSSTAMEGDQRKNKQSADTSVGEAIMWKEGKEGVVELPVDEPEVFGDYVQLLYTGALVVFNEPKRRPTPKWNEKRQKGVVDVDLRDLHMRDEVMDSYGRLTNLYVLCEKICDTTAKSAILAAFIELSDKQSSYGLSWPPTHVCLLEKIYAGTQMTDPLRAFVVDNYVLLGDSAWANDAAEGFPHEFLYDVMVCMYKDRAPPRSKRRVRQASYYQQKLLTPGLDRESRSKSASHSDSDVDSESD